ncbi:MAG: histidinol dehydrogenase [Methylococcales bacterium]|jgi:histidinol dehydrogenase|nr:histidinol dehydrogenase [Methylococcales bacterium]MBT7445592.1 histidinol dehydrogenase [Methylococcales bacterium]
MLDIKRLNTQSADFKAELKAATAYEADDNSQVVATVHSIIEQIKARGDDALIEYTNQFDGMSVNSMVDLELLPGQLKAAYDALPNDQREALDLSANRVRAYAEKQKMSSWQYEEADGTVLGQQVTPLDRVGLYVPGGKAAYPSSVLMNAIPAHVAGVEELIMVVPTPSGETNALVMAAAHVAGVTRVFTVGGAQAVAALAYGTQTVPPVDKIVGPGNIYVATAKGIVFGDVGIDMIAGPSEILVICDGSTDPDWIAMDLFSQAEHDELAQSVLICPDADYIEKVLASIERQLPTMSRQEIIAKSLADRGVIIQTKDLGEAMDVANWVAPEHLELSIKDPEAWVGKIKHAGAIFMGAYTAEVLGDYCAGPNHVLPTARTARFSSPLGVYDFQKRTSIIHCSAAGAKTLGKTASVMAHGEGLTAHAGSAEYRVKANG